jgi:uncharacterized membrane protein
MATPFPSAMLKQLQQTQIGEAAILVIGIFMVVVGRLGVEMYNRILTMKGDENQQLLNGNYAKNANTLFKVTTELGHWLIALLVAALTYNIGAKAYKKPVKFRSHGEKAMTIIQLLSCITATVLVFVQTVYGTTLYTKVLNWSLPGDKPEASKKQKDYAKRIYIFMIITMVITLAIFLFYGISELHPIWLEHATAKKEREVELAQQRPQTDATKAETTKSSAKLGAITGGWRSSGISPMPSVSGITSLSGGMSTFFNY